MKKDYVYVGYDEDADEFFILIGTGLPSLTTPFYYRFIDDGVDAGRYMCTILHPSQVTQIGKL